MRMCLTAAAVVTLALVGSASANLVNYYSFNSQTLNDEASVYTQNTGANDTNLTMNDPGGTYGTTYVTGIGSNYNVTAAPGDYAVYVKTNHEGAAEALVFPAGDGDLDLSGGGAHGWTMEFWVQAALGSWGGNTNTTFMAGTTGGPSMSFGSGAQPNITVNGRGATQDSGWSTTGWHHVAIVANNDGSWNYYFDGAIHASNATTGTTTAITALQFGVAAAARYNNGCQMYLDDIAMWDSALDGATVLTHATAGGLGLTLPSVNPTFHPGDINGDGVVDLQDFGTMKDNFGATSGAVWATGDLTGDGAIDLQDFGVLKDHFGHTNGDVPITAVPEPATMSLLALAGLGLIRRNKR